MIRCAPFSNRPDMRVRRCIGGKIVSFAALAACALRASAFTSSVTMREDKKLLVDGAPLFPIGLYSRRRRSRTNPARRSRSCARWASTLSSLAAA